METQPAQQVKKLLSPLLLDATAKVVINLTIPVISTTKLGSNAANDLTHPFKHNQIIENTIHYIIYFDIKT